MKMLKKKEVYDVELVRCNWPNKEEQGCNTKQYGEVVQAQMFFNANAMGLILTITWAIKYRMLNETNCKIHAIMMTIHFRI